FDIDGWRLDVSDEVSHSFWKEFRKHVKEIKKDVVLIGENWHDANSFLHGDEFDSIMNYAFLKALLDYLAFDNFDAKAMSDKLNELLMRNTIIVNKMMLNMIDSHDTLRFFTEVNRNLNKYFIALAILFFYEGVPCLYYGDENMMEGGYDPDSRRCFVESEHNQAYELIKELASLRKQRDFYDSDLYISYEENLLLLERRNNKCIYRLICNIASKKLYDASEILLSHNYQNKVMEQYSFVIERRKNEA
ncbi:MAG: alpha-amylase family glycosyl hydrolase, partial [Bacilli bacterium]